MSATTEQVAQWAVPCMDPDPGPLARLEAVQAQENTPSVVFQRLTDGETLKDIARAWEIPVGRFTEWFMGEHGALFEAAQRVRADQLANEALTVADGAAPETVKVDGLRVKTRLELASHWDRSRYGNAKEQAAGGITVLLDPSCGGTVQIEAGGQKLTIANRSTEALEKTITGETLGDHSSRTAG